MGKPDYENNAGARAMRRLRYALVAAFVAVFFFALLIQLLADAVGWATSTQIIFLFPQGIGSALTDLQRLFNVIGGLSLIAVFVAGVFYWRMWNVEERSSFSGYDDGD